MKLLIVTQAVDENNPVLGFFIDWIKEFAKHCESIIVICLYQGKYELPANVKVLSLGKERGQSIIKYLYRFYKYIWQERENYNTVFVHMNQIYVILGGYLWHLLNKKISFWYVHKKVSPQLRMAEKIADIIFTASVKSFRLKSKKVRVIGHGIDINKFAPAENKISNDKFKIVSAGRISPTKDYATLIDAIKLLVQDGKVKNIGVNIIGGPGAPEQESYFASLKKMVVEKKLELTIHFLGPIANKEIVKQLQESDLFINTSRTGSLDKAILEAMACGVPVLSSNDAYREMLNEYQNYLLIESGDAQQLADKVEKIIGLGSDQLLAIKNFSRGIVANHHSLNNLIAKILETLGAVSTELKA